MARLSKAQQLARSRIVDLCRRGLPPAELGRRVLEALSRAIPYDGYRLLGIDPGTLLVNRVIASSDNDAWARQEWLREVYLRADSLPYIEIDELMRLGLMAVASHERQEECWGYPTEVLTRVGPNAHREAFHELRSPVGGTLFACFAANGQWIAALQIYRRDRGAPFRRTDVAFVRLLGPLLGPALSAALRREHANLNGDRSETPMHAGVIILDPRGSPVYSTISGEAWARAFMDDAGPLPSAVLSAAAQARASDAGCGLVVARTATGPVQVEASAATDGSIAIVFAPHRPPPAAIIPFAWDLTASERRVAELTLRGLDNQTIAAHLSISEHTVRAHLRHTYEKLDINGRHQLMARYFSETFPTAPGSEWSSSSHLNDRR